VNHRFSSIFLNERISSDSFRVFALKGIVCFKEENISSNFISHIQANKRKNTKSTRQKQLKENARRRQFISFWFFFSFLIYVFIYVFDFVLEERRKNSNYFDILVQHKNQGCPTLIAVFCCT